MRAVNRTEVQDDSSQPIEILVHQVERSNERMLYLVQNLMREIANRNFVIRNYEGNSVLQVPLSSAIVGGVMLTTVLRLRSVLLLALGAALGRVYFSIEPFAEEAEDIDVLLEQEEQGDNARSTGSTAATAASRKRATKSAASKAKARRASSNGSN